MATRIEAEAEAAGERVRGAFHGTPDVDTDTDTETAHDTHNAAATVLALSGRGRPAASARAAATAAHAAQRAAEAATQIFAICATRAAFTRARCCRPPKRSTAHERPQCRRRGTRGGICGAAPGAQRTPCAGPVSEPLAAAADAVRRMTAHVRPKPSRTAMCRRRGARAIEYCVALGAAAVFTVAGATRTGRRRDDDGGRCR